jgi:hypothetical protein
MVVERNFNLPMALLATSESAMIHYMPFYPGQDSGSGPRFASRKTSGPDHGVAS